MTVRERDLPVLSRQLSPAAAAAWIPRTCFKHGPPAQIGIELEQLVHDVRSPSRPTSGPSFDPLGAAQPHCRSTGG
jgi:hypothetical protein